MPKRRWRGWAAVGNCDVGIWGCAARVAMGQERSSIRFLRFVETASNSSSMSLDVPFGCRRRLARSAQKISRQYRLLELLTDRNTRFQLGDAPPDFVTVLEDLVLR